MNNSYSEDVGKKKQKEQVASVTGGRHMRENLEPKISIWCSVDLRAPMGKQQWL